MGGLAEDSSPGSATGFDPVVSSHSALTVPSTLDTAVSAIQSPVTDVPHQHPPAQERRSGSVSERHLWTSPTPYTLTSDTHPVKAALERRAAWSRPLVRRAIVVDGTLAALALAPVLHPLIGTSTPVLIAASLAWVSLLGVAGAYSCRQVGDCPGRPGAGARAFVALLVLTGVLATIGVSVPPLIVPALALAAFLGSLHRHRLRLKLRARRRSGLVAPLRTLVVGTSSEAQNLSTTLAKAPAHAMVVVGSCSPSQHPSGPVPVLGTLSQVPQVVVDHHVDVVVVTGSSLSPTGLRRLSWGLENTGADLFVESLSAASSGAISSAVQLHPSAGPPLTQVPMPSSRRTQVLVKKVTDRLLSALLLVLTSPLLALSALAVAVTSRGPVFYRQDRVGQDGRVFTMFKLRTMGVDADLRRVMLVDANQADGPLFKVRRDPRVTPVGRFLRKLSIDELPQLYNVLRGDMALVGPRPPLPHECAAYRADATRRLRVRPGLTGLWQVSGRSDLGWEDSLALDLHYVDNWSLWLDLRVLGATAGAVLTGRGAY